MKPSLANANSRRIRARNAVLLNLLGTPGLGSFLGGRRMEGLAQLVLALAGFALLMTWFVRLMVSYYGQITGGEPAPANQGMGLLGGGLFAAAWIWSLATSLSLVRNSAAPGIEPPVLPSPTEAPDVPPSAPVPPGWTGTRQSISRTYEFADFAAAMRFTNAVAALAEASDHHPDVDIRWNKVTLVLTSHDAGRVTGRDLAMARQCDALSRE